MGRPAATTVSPEKWISYEEFLLLCEFCNCDESIRVLIDNKCFKSKTRNDSIKYIFNNPFNIDIDILTESLDNNLDEVINISNMVNAFINTYKYDISDKVIDSWYCFKDELEAIEQYLISHNPDTKVSKKEKKKKKKLLNSTNTDCLFILFDSQLLTTKDKFCPIITNYLEMTKYPFNFEDEDLIAVMQHTTNYQIKKIINTLEKMIIFVEQRDEPKKDHIIDSIAILKVCLECLVEDQQELPFEWTEEDKDNYRKNYTKETKVEDKKEFKEAHILDFDPKYRTLFPEEK